MLYYLLHLLRDLLCHLIHAVAVHSNCPGLNNMLSDLKAYSP